MISKSILTDKAECGICFNEEKTISCNRCKYKICSNCWKQLLKLDNGDVSNVRDGLTFNNLEFKIKCPGCRKEESSEITNSYVDSIHINKYDLIEKINDFEALSKNDDDYSDNYRSAGSLIIDDENIEDNQDIYISVDEPTPMNVIERFRANQDARVHRLALENNDYRDRERNMRNTIQILRHENQRLHNFITLLRENINDDNYIATLRENLEE